MFYKNSLTWSIMRLGKTPVHVIGVYLAPYNDEETFKSINMLKYILMDRILSKY